MYCEKCKNILYYYSTLYNPANINYVDVYRCSKCNSDVYIENKEKTFELRRHTIFGEQAKYE